MENWKQCASFLSPGGEAAGTVNAISIDNLYSFSGTAITRHAAAIAAHEEIWQSSGYFRTYPMIGFGDNITQLRPLWGNHSWLVDFLATEAEASRYDGINIDFEPLTDVVHPDNNPTIDDALGLAAFLQDLGDRLHQVVASRAR